MRSLALLLALVGSVIARTSPRIIQPLPEKFDAGDARVVFLRNRMNVLPENFGHNAEGIKTYFIAEIR
jgi:hypothetical protein